MNRQIHKSCKTCVTTRATRIVTGTDHYKKVCAECGTYVSWVGLGESKYIDIINNIDMEKLTVNERIFLTQAVRMAYTHGYNLTYTQTAKLQGIIARCSVAQ